MQLKATYYLNQPFRHASASGQTNRQCHSIMCIVVEAKQLIKHSIESSLKQIFQTN